VEKFTQWVKTAAFLGDLRIRIFDKNDHLIVDSGAPEGSSDLMLVLPQLDLGQLESELNKPPMLLYQYDYKQLIRKVPLPFMDDLPQDASITVLQRSVDTWIGGYTLKSLNLSDELQSVKIDSEVGVRSKVSFKTPISDNGYVEVSGLPDYGSVVLNQVRKALFFGGGGAVLFAGIVGFWISQWLSSPLKKLAQTSAEMGLGNLSVRAEVKTKGEIGELAAQFNTMASDLETSFQQLGEERDALRRFITDASHELRTPITALKNFNTLIADDLVDQQTRKEFIQESAVQIQRLEWITTNLLDLSRLDSGLGEMNLEDFDIKEIVKTAVGTFRSIAAEKNLTLDTHLPQSPCILLCDRGRVEIALSNILDNAVKFTPEGGIVEIGIDAVDEVQVWVRDNGIGISSDELPRIFDRFYRAPGHGEHGSGLGLAIVKSIVEAHQGQVSVESSPGEGTTIRITFPS
jgi:signal transduction histidine kinase